MRTWRTSLLLALAVLIAPSLSWAGLDVKVGSFTLNTSTGNQAVTGVGFQPTIVLFFYNVSTGDGASVDAAGGFGVGISSTARHAVGWWSEDAQATADVVRCAQVDAAICNRIGTSNLVADFVSQDVNGFTINITASFGSATVVNYIALAGTDLTNVFVGNATVPASTGTQDYTGVGFEPDAMIFFQSTSSTAQEVLTGGNVLGFIGTASSASDQGVTALRQTDGSAAADTAHYQSTSSVLASVTASAVFWEGALASFDADGFTINWTTVASGRYFYYVALKGAQFKSGTFNQATGTGNQSVTGLGLDPSVVLFTSANAATSASVDADSQFSYGAGASSSARFAQWSGGNDAADPMEEDSVLENDEVLVMYAPDGTPTLNAEADYVSDGSGSFTVNWSTADATAREILYFAIGTTAAPAGRRIFMISKADDMVGLWPVRLWPTWALN